MNSKIQSFDPSEWVHCDDNSTVTMSSTTSDLDFIIDADLPSAYYDQEKETPGPFMKAKSVSFNEEIEIFTIPNRKIPTKFPRIRFCRTVEIKYIPSRNQLSYIFQDLWYTSQDIENFASEFDNEKYQAGMADFNYLSGAVTITLPEGNTQKSSSPASSSISSCIQFSLPAIRTPACKKYQTTVLQSNSNVISMMQTIFHDKCSLPSIVKLNSVLSV